MLQEDELPLRAHHPAGVALLDPERRHARVEQHDVARLVVAQVRPLRRRQVAVHIALDLEFAPVQHTLARQPVSHDPVDLRPDEMRRRQDRRPLPLAGIERQPDPGRLRAQLLLRRLMHMFKPLQRLARAALLQMLDGGLQRRVSLAQNLLHLRRYAMPAFWSSPERLACLHRAQLAPVAHKHQARDPQAPSAARISSSIIWSVETIDASSRTSTEPSCSCRSRTTRAALPRSPWRVRNHCSVRAREPVSSRRTRAAAADGASRTALRSPSSPSASFSMVVLPVPAAPCTATIRSCDNRAVRTITRGLIELKLLKGNLNKLIKDQAYRKYYMHRTGHWLGLDVHDVGDYKVGDQWRLLEPGMVMTIEPGIYIPAGTRGAHRKWWNIGIRIEDDVLVTRDGCEILTDALPRKAQEIETLMAG